MAAIGPIDEGVSWYSTGVDFASPQENIIAALSLVYHATSTGGEELLKKHMAEIITASVDYTPDGSWRPPSSWQTTERHIVDQARDWLEQATPNDQKGTVSPVIHVAAKFLQHLHYHQRHLPLASEALCRPSGQIPRAPSCSLLGPHGSRRKP